MPESTAAQPITEDLKTLLWLAQGVFAQTLKRSNSSARPKTLDHAKERAQNDCMPESQCTLCRSELDLPHVMVNISHFGGLSAVLSKLSRLFGTSLVELSFIEQAKNRRKCPLDLMRRSILQNEQPKIQSNTGGIFSATVMAATSGTDALMGMIQREP